MGDVAMPELFISAFLGFLSALFVELIVKLLAEASKAKDTLNGIKNELERVGNILDGLNNELYYITPLNIPFWNSIIFTDNVNCLLNKKYYSDIIMIYQYINNMNDWENLRTETFFIKSVSNKILNMAVLQKRDELSGELKALFNKYNGVW